MYFISKFFFYTYLIRLLFLKYKEPSLRKVIKKHLMYVRKSLIALYITWEIENIEESVCLRRTRRTTLFAFNKYKFYCSLLIWKLVILKWLENCVYAYLSSQRCWCLLVSSCHLSQENMSPSLNMSLIIYNNACKERDDINVGHANIITKRRRYTNSR